MLDQAPLCPQYRLLERLPPRPVPSQQHLDLAYIPHRLRRRLGLLPAQPPLLLHHLSETVHGELIGRVVGPSSRFLEANIAG